MRFHATNERALRTAKRLRDVANATASTAVPVTLGSAKEALALAWGYSGWAELTRSCETGPRSHFDEDASAETVASRHTRHVRAMSTAFGLDPAPATDLALRAGLTSRAPTPKVVPTQGIAPAPARPALGVGSAAPLGLGDEAYLFKVLGLGGTSEDRALLVLGALTEHLAGGRGCLVVDASGDAARQSAIRAVLDAAGPRARPLVVDATGRAGEGLGTDAFNPFATENVGTLARMLTRIAGLHGRSDRVETEDLARVALEPLLRRRDELRVRIGPRCFAEAVRALADRDGASKDIARVAAPLADALDAMHTMHGHVFDVDPTFDMGAAISEGRTVAVFLDGRGEGSPRAGAIGRAVMATLRRAMVERLGKPVVGDWRSTVDLRPPSREPYAVVLDGVGGYVTDDDVPLLAQAKSLDLMVTIMAEGAEELARCGTEVALHIERGSRTKVMMRSDGATARIGNEHAARVAPSSPDLAAMAAEMPTLAAGAAWVSTDFPSAEATRAMILATAVDGGMRKLHRLLLDARR